MYLSFILEIMHLKFQKQSNLWLSLTIWYKRGILISICFESNENVAHNILLVFNQASIFPLFHTHFIKLFSVEYI